MFYNVLQYYKNDFKHEGDITKNQHPPLVSGAVTKYIYWSTSNNIDITQREKVTLSDNKNFYFRFFC